MYNQEILLILSNRYEMAQCIYLTDDNTIMFHFYWPLWCDDDHQVSQLYHLVTHLVGYWEWIVSDYRLSTHHPGSHLRSFCDRWHHPTTNSTHKVSMKYGQPTNSSILANLYTRRKNHSRRLSILIYMRPVVDMLMSPLSKHICL